MPAPRLAAVSFAALAALAHSAAAQPALRSESRTMSFEACLALIRSTAQQLRQAPINIVETADVRMVRFVTTDGSVIVTCSRPDRKVVITQSPNRGG